MRPAPELIVIGGSAGSLQVILKIIDHLQDNFCIPLLLVLHRHVNADSPLEELLDFRSTLIAREVEEKDRITPGYIYVCPADYHVLIEEDRSFSLDDSEKINFSRPSIDVVFRSAAEVFGDRVMCILLSGANGDGSEGLSHVVSQGGRILIQEPGDAQVPYMPQHALKRIKPDYLLPGMEMAGLLNSFC